MNRIAIRVGIGAAAVAAAAVTTLALLPSSSATSPAAGPHAGAASTIKADWSALSATAQSEGKVNVIVGLTDNTAGMSTNARIDALTKQRQQLLDQFGKYLPDSVRGIAGAPFFSVSLTPKQLSVLQTLTGIDYVQANRTHTVEDTSPNGDDAGQQLPVGWDQKQIGADWANSHGYTGAGQKVVIIDTGVDSTNPYLQGKVVNEACFASYSDGSGACPNGSYYDYSTDAAGVAGAAAPCDYSHSCAHGTFVAQQAAGEYGVARGASIIAIRAAHKEYDADLKADVPLFNDIDLQNALWYVDNVLSPNGNLPAAVNISVGGGKYANYCDDDTPGVANEINLLKKHWEVAVVVSSGNDNFNNAVSSPGCVTNAITVGNTTLDSNGDDAVFGNIDGGSNTSQIVDLLAPGTDICSAVPVKLDDRDGKQDGWECGWIGTSMAAPQVTGAIAILTQKHPNASVDQALAALQRSGQQGGTAITDSRNGVTRTRINVAWAVYGF
jgi:subtilisin family serine protease